jgi:hypothetical protein
VSTCTTCGREQIQILTHIDCDCHPTPRAIVEAERARLTRGARLRIKVTSTSGKTAFYRARGDASHEWSTHPDDAELYEHFPDRGPDAPAWDFELVEPAFLANLPTSKIVAT